MVSGQIILKKKHDNFCYDKSDAKPDKFVNFIYHYSVSHIEKYHIKKNPNDCMNDFDDN